MSQSKYSTLKVSSKDPSLPPTGANTKIEIDGVPMKMVTFVKVEASSRKMTKILIEMFAHVELDVMGEFQTKIVDLHQKK